MRPNLVHVGGTFFWTILVRDPDTEVLKDADSNPTVEVRKNGASVGDSVTITKRSATTGIYDCSYDPAGDVEGDVYQFEETAVVTGTTTPSRTYRFNWSARIVAIERGTNGALTSLGATAPANWINGASIATDARTAIATAVEAAFLNDGDGQQFISSMQATVQALFDSGVDVPITTIANAVRDAILNRVLATNHEVAGSVGKLLQFLDAFISSRMATFVYTVPPTSAAIADAVWDEQRTGHVNPGTFGIYLDQQISTISGGGPGGSVDTSSFSGTALAILQAIQQTAANVIVASGIKLGAAGFPGSLYIGDARSVETNTALIIRIYDADNPTTPLTAIGSRNLSDALLTLSFKRPGADSHDAEVNCSFHTSGPDAWIRAVWDKDALNNCVPDLSSQYRWAIKAEWGSVGARVDPLTIASGRVYITSRIVANH